MITVVIVVLAIYLAVRFTLSEASKKLRQIQAVWKMTVCSFNHPEKAADSDGSIRVTAEDVHTSLDEITEKSERVPARRKTGIVNGKTVCRQPSTRKLSRAQLVLPFMDTGLFQGNCVGRTSPKGLRSLSREEKQGFVTDQHQSSNRGADDNILNMFKVPTEDRNRSIFSRLFHHVSFILQRNTPINYSDVSEKVLASDRVKSAIKTAVIEEFKDEDPDDAQIITAQLNHKQRAVTILQNMRSCISAFLLKIAAWVMYKLLGRMLDGIEVHKGQIQTLRRASQNNVPIIYLPLHRSHLDYILVTFILYMNDLRAPLVAAGNNLMIPFFGALLRGLGAFFIKRKLDPQHGQRDFVYRAILHTYMEKSLMEGHSLEFFIEGGRSRTGKAVLPKAGLLSIVVDTLVSGGITDAYIVPIAMSYEKLLDGNFVSEQMGKPKKMESFSTAVQAIWRTLHSNFGSVRVDFCHPFSLKEFLLAAEYSYNLTCNTLHPSIPKLYNCAYDQMDKARRRSEYGSEIVTEDHRQVIKDLADYIVYDAFNTNALMTTNILAFLLMTKHRKGTTFHYLVSSLNWLREEITKRNKTISFVGNSEELLKKASTLLGDKLVNVESIQMEWSSGEGGNNMRIIFYKPAVSLPEVLELQYYANAVLPVFLLESIIVNAAYTVAFDEVDNNFNKGNAKSIVRGQLLKRSIELCNLLQYEFIFSPPGTSLYTVLNATIDDMVKSGAIQVIESLNSELVQSEKTLMNSITKIHYHEYFAEEDSNLSAQNLKFSTEAEHSNMLQFLKCILSPFIESYWLVSHGLPKLLHGELEEMSLLQEIKRIGMEKVHSGQLCYEESLGLDTLRNALKVFESWKVVKVSSQNSQKIYRLYSYYNDKNSLRDFISSIEVYRR